MAFAGDGERVVSCSADRSAIVWHLPTGKKLLQIRQDKYPGALAVHRSEPLFAVGCDDNLIRLYNLDTGRAVDSRMAHTAEVVALAFSPAGELLASAGEDKTARVWRLARATGSHAVLRHPGPVMALGTLYGRSVLACSRGGVWEFPTATRGGPRRVVDHPVPSALATYALGRSAAVGFADGTARVIDLASGRTLAGPWAHGRAVLAVAVSPNGRLVATGCDDPDWVVRVRDVKTGRVVHELVGHERKVVRWRSAPTASCSSAPAGTKRPASGTWRPASPSGRSCGTRTSRRPSPSARAGSWP